MPYFSEKDELSEDQIRSILYIASWHGHNNNEVNTDIVRPSLL